MGSAIHFQFFQWCAGWRALVGVGCCWELWKGRTSPDLGLSRGLVRPVTLHGSWILNNCTAPGLLWMAPWKCWTTFMSLFVNSRRWGRKLSGLRSVISAITCSDSSLNRYFMHFYYIIFWSTAIKSMTFIVHSTRKCVSYWFLCVYLRILFILLSFQWKWRYRESNVLLYCSEKYPSSLYFEPSQRMTSHIPIFFSHILVWNVSV